MMLFNRFIIFFFYFFLISRYFSEKLKILPKWVDVVNYGLFFVLLVFIIFSLNKKSLRDNGENSFILKILTIFTITFFVSILFNQNRILPEATVLFYLGFMEGPVLFIALNKLSKYPYKLAANINKIFFVLLLINLIIIFAADIPEFLISGNPDVISGTYGNNTYQFSMLLLICGSYLLGYNYIKNYRTWFVIISQILIMVVFYLSQFRAGLPFFLLSYLIIIGFLYGKKIIWKFIPIAVFLMLFSYLLLFITEKDEKIEALKFDDWIGILSEPRKYLDYGKFKIYRNIPAMWADEPQTFIIGSGPGNMMSRANFTFSYELLQRNKGTSLLLKDLFGIEYPYFSYLHNKYVRYSIKSEAIYGTWQLSNPYTSYLAGIAEIGIIGGISIIVLYIYLIGKSIEYFHKIKITKPEFLPLSVALVSSTVYLFGLAFLENYWEIARVTLPVWLLLWAVKTEVYNDSMEIETGN